jgi:UDP-N-acetylmuramoyl-tripeptide--D-alanyl-D-alanine ligase
MGIFISVEKTVECVAVAVLLSVALMFMSYRILGTLQSLGYSGKKLFRWLGKQNNMTYDRLCLLVVATLLSSAVLALCFCFLGDAASIVSLVAFAIFFALYAYADNKQPLRSPVTLTARFKRLSVVVWLVYAIVIYIIVTLLNFVAFIWGNSIFGIFKYCVLCLLPFLAVPLISLGNLIDKLYETPKNNRYVKRAKEKLAASKLKVVGITGSYGKTSAKCILAAMLSKKYRVLSTPRSHNTPMGLSLAINDNDIENYDIFIAEMGARNVGDISELCAICPPDYALITGICPQHLESFSTLENIIKAKGEIISATKNRTYVSRDAYDYFAGANENVTPCDCVSDVRSDYTGTAFKLTLGAKTAEVKTKLLGEHSAYNIGLCALLAYDLGVSFEEIAECISSLPYVEHRLQLIESNGVNIIDDGYNANVKGAEAAVNVLKTFPSRKIVVTPGLVELGVLEEEENSALGALLAGLDYVILVGETLVGAVKSGYLAAGGDAEKIVTVPNLFAAQDKLKQVIARGDTVLFLNDLPDIYL